MPSKLYSTTCYIKSDLYRLCIYVDDNDQNSTNIEDPIDSFEFTSTNISKDDIKPSLTRLSFELLNEKKNMIIPKTIPLNHLLNVEQANSIPNKNKRKFNDITNISTIEQSQRGSRTTLNATNSEFINQSTPPIRRQFSFKKLFSTQSVNTDSENNLILKTLVKLSYIDVSNSIRWNIKRLELEVETEDIANELYDNLNLCLLTLKQRPKRLLAFINPSCGKGQARFVYDKKVLPIFKEANISVDTVYTERANHAQEYVINEDLTGYSGLVCVGGDGMFSELCHGLLLRKSREAHIDIDNPQVNIIRPDIKIGIIPAGSTDAVVFGTTGLNDPVTSALQITVGETLSIDITTIHNEMGFVRFMATMLSYGFFGDIIHQSNSWRCLGPLRYDLAGFCQFVRNKSYHSELTITLSPNDSSQMSHPHTVLPMNNVSGGSTASVAPDSQQLLNNVNRTTIENSSLNAIREIIAPALAFCNRNCEICAIAENQDPNKVNSPLQIKREGRYATINCLNMPCRCAKSKFGMSPFVHLGDGTFDLILVKRSWRTGFLRFLWQVANDGRTIEDLPNVERYRVSEVLIRPVETDPKKIGNWACDGELIHGNEIQIRIHRQALSLFASGIQFNKTEEYKQGKRNEEK